MIIPDAPALFNAGTNEHSVCWSIITSTAMKSESASVEIVGLLSEGRIFNIKGFQTGNQYK